MPSNGKFYQKQVFEKRKIPFFGFFSDFFYRAKTAYIALSSVTFVWLQELCDLTNRIASPTGGQLLAVPRSYENFSFLPSGMGTHVTVCTRSLSLPTNGSCQSYISARHKIAAVFMFISLPRIGITAGVLPERGSETEAGGIFVCKGAGFKDDDLGKDRQNYACPPSLLNVTAVGYPAGRIAGSRHDIE